MIGLAALGISVVGGAVHGAFHRNSPLFGPALGKIESDRKVVALTFDDGPNPDATPLILDTLREKRVRATFFILGSHAERWPELVRRIAHDGHQIGNHGYFHRKLQFKSPFYVSRDIRLGIRAIKRAGAPAPRYFRAPHGFRSPWTTPIARSYGERAVLRDLSFRLARWRECCPARSSCSTMATATIPMATACRPRLRSHK